MRHSIYPEQTHGGAQGRGNELLDVQQLQFLVQKEQHYGLSRGAESSEVEY